MTFPGQKPPPLKFGEHGELTMETIEAANLTPAERERALEILEAQHAYLDIIDTASSHIIDPEGNQYDLSGLQPVVWALAWTLSLAGFRRSAPPHIKKRFYSGDQILAGSFAWVDVRAADDAADELLPEHRADDESLPADTRMLAAKRDGVKRAELPSWDGQKIEVKVVDEPRPDWM